MTVCLKTKEGEKSATRLDQRAGSGWSDNLFVYKVPNQSPVGSTQGTHGEPPWRTTSTSLTANFPRKPRGTRAYRSITLTEFWNPTV